jgi:hypothetical protein
LIKMKMKIKEAGALDGVAWNVANRR